MEDREKREAEEERGREEESVSAEESVSNESAAQEEADRDPEAGKKGFAARRKASGESKVIRKLKEEAEKAAADLEESKNRCMRLAAEYDNYKKRTAKELDARYADAMTDILKELLPVLDNFERGLAAECSDSAYKDGVALIFKQFTDLLAQHGVVEIEAAGRPFDPNLHNAVMHIEDESLGDNTVAEVFMKGYQQGDKVLRHSMVKVAN